eukprot:c602_g1_i1 orf=465-1403(+)
MAERDVSRSKILIIGATGFIGKYITKASIAQGHPTYLLVRTTTETPDNTKLQLLESFKMSGAIILHGSLEDYGSLVAAIKQVDVVISTVGHHGSELLGQMPIIRAIKEVGTVKRFIPSEFGVDVDRDLAKPMKLMLGVKCKIRRAIQESGIPYTFVSCNNTFLHFLKDFNHTGVTSPPRDKVEIFGDGNTKAVYVAEDDIGEYTINAVDDPRTLNKILYIRPPANILSLNELVAMWERKISKTLQKEFVSKEILIKQMEELPFPQNLLPAFRVSIYVWGVELFELDSSGVEATQLYPHVKYMTVDDFLNCFV